MLYHLFYCSDYKGGELYCWTNLDINEAIEIVYNDCFDYFIENKCILDNDASILIALDNYYNDNYWEYAYGGKCYPKLFVIKEDELKNTWFTDEQLLNWVKNNYDTTK